MELRVLQYFLAEAKEQNISAASHSLHLTQPTLPAKLRSWKRNWASSDDPGSRKITLTRRECSCESGREILDLVGRPNGITQSNKTVSGDIYIEPARPTESGNRQSLF